MSYLTWISIYLEKEPLLCVEKDNEFIFLALNASRPVDICWLFFNRNSTSQSDQSIQSLLMNEKEKSFDDPKVNNYIRGLSLVDLSIRRQKAGQRFEQTSEILYSKFKRCF